LKVKINLSFAYHLETFGQTERVNQILEQYLLCTINYHQANRVDLLSLAESAYNNTLHSSTKQTSFYSNYGQHPKEDLFQLKAVGSPAVEELLGRMTTIHNELKLQLRQAQDRYKEYVDVYRKVQPTFKVGDHIWLLRRNIQITRPSSKLDFQRLGPFPIINP
jgi:hypothetical protein